MMILLVSIVVFAVVMTAMAVGVMAGRKPISGSCGGIAALREHSGGVDGPVCEICGARPGEQCQAEDGAAASETGELGAPPER